MIQDYLNYLQDDSYPLNEFIVLPTLAISYKAYQRFLSKAAKACNDKKFGAKTLCMVKYRLKAISILKPQLQKSLGQCSTTKDPDKCKQKIKGRIERLEKTEEKLHAKMTTLSKV